MKYQKKQLALVGNVQKKRTHSNVGQICNLLNGSPVESLSAKKLTTGFDDATSLVGLRYIPS